MPTASLENFTNLAAGRFEGGRDLQNLVADFHAAHEEIFAINDLDSIVEFVGWTASVACRLAGGTDGRLTRRGGAEPIGSRPIFFEGSGIVDTPMTDGIVNPDSIMVSSPLRVSQDISRALQRQTNVLYTPRKWRWIMCIIRSIPEQIFKRLKM